MSISIIVVKEEDMKSVYIARRITQSLIPTKLVVLLALLLTLLGLPGCEDEPTISENGFLMNGTFHETSFGYLAPFAKNVSNDSYSIDLFLTTAQLSTADELDTGLNFNLLSIYFNSSNQENLTSGEYNFSDDKNSFTFEGGVVQTVGFSGSIPVILEITEGTISITKSDQDEVEINYSLQTFLGNSVSGKYSGKLTTLN